MTEKDFSSELLIDEILEEVKELNGDNSGVGKLWSLADIDALLSDEPITSAEEPKNEIKKEPEKAAIEKQVKKELEIDEKKEPNLKEVAYKNTIENVESEEPEKSEEKKKPADEPTHKTDEKLHFKVAKVPEPQRVKESQKTEVKKKAEKIGEASEISPLLDSVVEEPETEVEPENRTDEKVEGQISIEKTRVFNEVDARSIRDNNINHNIGKQKIYKTDKGGEYDPYRERFFNKPEQDLEKTQDHIHTPNKTIENYGIVMKKDALDKTDANGLSPLPKLVDAADEYEAQRTKLGTFKENAFEDENQIKLDGFDDSEDEVEIVDEAEAEANLRKARKDKIKKFRLFPNLDVEEAMEYDEDSDEEEFEDDTDNEKTKAVTLPENVENETVEDDDEELSGEENPKKHKEYESVRVAREFFGPKDAKAVFDIFVKEQRGIKLNVFVSAFALAMSLFAAIVTSFGNSFSLFGEKAQIYSAFNLIILVIVALFNIKAIKECFSALKKKHINSSCGITLALTVGILQCAVSFMYPDLVLSGTHIYAGVALFPVLLINIGNLVRSSNDINNFLLIGENSDDFYASKSVEDEDVAFEIGRGLMIREPDVKYNTKVDFPYRFVEMSKLVDPTSHVFSRVLPISLIIAVVVGIISGIVNKNIFVALTSFTGVCLMAVPSAAGVSMFGILKHFNNKLNRNGAMISGFEAVENALEANAVVVDAKDLFTNDSTATYKIKTFNNMRIDEAILYTAAVAIQSKGALGDLFDTVIMSNHEILPEVESLAYEEKLGCSGWINNRRVLVGNRDLLIKHSVKVQSKEEESVFTRDGMQIVYIAVEGKVSAMFVVDYVADSEIAKYMRYLEKNSVNILVRTTDANISEEFVEQRFGLPKNFIKVISPVAGTMFSLLSESEAENEPCRILNNGSVKSFLHSFASAFSLNDSKKLSALLQYIGIGIGILIMAMFSFVSGISQVGVLQIIIFETIWTLISVFVPKIKKI